MKTLKFVIVGHVDHGKSTLIGRLLYDTNLLPPDKFEEVKKTSQELGKETEFAYLLDHLEEERQQGITIDTTQVFFKTDQRQYVIIDAPGHVEFVKNMITGASQAEAAVLIIDTKEGVKEQTKRHAYMLSLLGLEQVVVVLNKMDLVQYDKEQFSGVRDQVQEFLSTINIKPLFYIPISAIQGEGIAKKSKKLNWYNGPTFLESLDGLRNKESAHTKPLLYPVQDIYKIEEKRIIAGRIEAGSLRKDETIKVLGSNAVTKASTIEKYLEHPASASAGESIGITTAEPVFINRGDIVCTPQKEPVFTDTFDANIFWMSKRDFNKDDRLIIRCATQEIPCRIKSIRRRIDSSSLATIEENASHVKNLEVAQVRIKTKKPIAITAFGDVQELGRFVLVQDENICAGGIIPHVLK